MALIEWNAQLTETNKMLERVARALERILLAEYGITIGHCAEAAADPNPSEKATVGYHTDEDSLKNDLEALAGRARLEEEEEEFGV